MNEYEEIRKDIDTYLMKRFKYRLSLVYLTPDNVVACRRTSRVDLYLRIRQKKACSRRTALLLPESASKKNV